MLNIKLEIIREGGLIHNEKLSFGGIDILCMELNWSITLRKNKKDCNFVFTNFL